MGDFSGDPTSPLKPLKDRKFIQIDRDNFDDVMSKMTPGLKFKVENTLQKDGSEIGVDLKFGSMADFDPARVVQQVEPLRKMIETRNKLRDLLSKADRSDELDSLLERVLKNQEDLNKLAGDLGDGGDKGGAA
jgi:type VI secretion system protein ImpB